MEQNNMRFKAGDLIKSDKFPQAGTFKLAIIMDTSESKHRKNFLYYHMYIVDWDEEQRYSAYTAERCFDLISAP